MDWVRIYGIYRVCGVCGVYEVWRITSRVMALQEFSPGLWDFGDSVGQEELGEAEFWDFGNLGWVSWDLWDFRNLGGQGELGWARFMGFWEFSLGLWDVGNLSGIYGMPHPEGRFGGTSRSSFSSSLRSRTWEWPGAAPASNNLGQPRLGGIRNNGNEEKSWILPNWRRTWSNPRISSNPSGMLPAPDIPNVLALRAEPRRNSKGIPEDLGADRALLCPQARRWRIPPTPSLWNGSGAHSIISTSPWP